MFHASRRSLYTYVLIFFAAIMLTMVPAHKTYAEKPYKKCSPKEVHPIWWKGTIRYDVDVKIRETKETKTLEAGTKVTVMNYSYYNKPKSVMLLLKDGTHCKVKPSAFTLYEDACTKGDYAKSTKVAFINSKKISSKTKYLIWVSTDMQSLNVFTGSKGNWVLKKVFKCSTGMHDWQTPIGARSIVAKMPVCHSDKWGSNLQFFLSFGGSGIHKWPGSGAGANLGKHPCSHSCIRLGYDNSKWCYKHIPVGTRLLVY